MVAGYRFFAVIGDNVIRISEKAFTDFYLRERPSLSRFKSQEITIATVVCELRGRTPTKIIKIETQRVKVGAGGAMEEGFTSEIIQLIARHALGDRSVRDFHGGKVVDALPNFDERRWAQMHPVLSGPQLQQILDDLFG